MTGELLAIERLVVKAAGSAGGPALLDGMELVVGRRETVALVGESGSGKTMTALAAIGLLPAGVTAAAGSVIRFDGTPFAADDRSAMAPLRGRRIGMVFQDPVGSLNPVMKVRDHLIEALATASHRSRRDREGEELRLLREVGFADPERVADSWPHELSGGMAQRVMIAMALAGDPDLLIADEPTASLDTVSQREIMDLLRSLRSSRGLAILLITHDLGVVAELADRVVVIHSGQPLEAAPVRDFIADPWHPHGRAMLEAAIRLDLPRELPRPIPGNVDGTVTDSACRFISRGRTAERQGSELRPPVIISPDGTRKVWCWNPDDSDRGAP